jgi:hypothetical protein
LSLKWIYTDYDVCGIAANTYGAKGVRNAKKEQLTTYKVIKENSEKFGEHSTQSRINQCPHITTASLLCYFTVVSAKDRDML